MRFSFKIDSNFSIVEDTGADVDVDVDVITTAVVSVAEDGGRDDEVEGEDAAGSWQSLSPLSEQE